MSSVINLKKVDIDYSFYSKPIRLGCPPCKYNTTRKTRTFHSMKSLLYHLSAEHSNEDNYYPFTMGEIKILMQAVAKSMELKLLVD